MPATPRVIRRKMDIKEYYETPEMVIEQIDVTFLATSGNEQWTGRY